MSSSDQQQLYENAATIRLWLGSAVPNDIVVKKVGAILSKSVEVTHHVFNNGGKPHIPRILLSASVEFREAYSQEPRGEPDLRRISVDDERIKRSPWYRENVETPPPDDGASSKEPGRPITLRIPPRHGDGHWPLLTHKGSVCNRCRALNKRCTRSNVPACNRCCRKDVLCSFVIDQRHWMAIMEGQVLHLAKELEEIKQAISERRVSEEFDRQSVADVDDMMATIRGEKMAPSRPDATMV